MSHNNRDVPKCIFCGERDAFVFDHTIHHNMIIRTHVQCFNDHYDKPCEHKLNNLVMIGQMLCCNGCLMPIRPILNAHDIGF